MAEEWKVVPGYSRYIVSNTGKIKSLDYRGTGRKIELKKTLSKKGYLQIMLVDDNYKKKCLSVHRIVLLAFCGNSDLDVNHKDGDKANNNINNLEYCSRSDNLKHAYKNGLREKPFGEKNPKSKLSRKQVEEIRDYKEKYGYLKNSKELALKYNISAGALYHTAYGTYGRWSHI